jgi:uncharacterized protein YecE (DUF72 family)
MNSTAFDRAGTARALHRLALQGVFLGTSSWKYPGWAGQLYDPGRYRTRGVFSNTKFERGCLQEYAEVFPTVCVDAAYYKFPTPHSLTTLAEQVPDVFLFGFKVTDLITIKNFPALPRFGDKAGKDNTLFLSAEAFIEKFLEPCASIREKVGVLIFEFSRFTKRDFDKGRDFVAQLDAFLAKLPKEGWQYAVEIRNHTFLTADYFATLARHNTAHVFNQWTKMPPVSEQLRMEGALTTDFVVARFLLADGRTYQQAVDAFSPYDRTQAPDPASRTAAATLIERAKSIARRRSFLFFNNRLEGNALNTIAAVVEH